MTDPKGLPLSVPQEILNIDAWRDNLFTMDRMVRYVRAALGSLAALGVAPIGLRQDASVSAALKHLQSLERDALRLAGYARRAAEELTDPSRNPGE